MKDFSVYATSVYKIIGAAMEVHQILSFGLLEPVYQEALQMELYLRKIDSKREQGIDIYYKGQMLTKKYKMDLVVDDIIIETKSVERLLPEHRAQLFNYLRLTHKPVGLLINFGEESLKAERWIYDEETNRCFLTDKNLQPISKIGL